MYLDSAYNYNVGTTVVNVIKKAFREFPPIVVASSSSFDSTATLLLL